MIFIVNSSFTVYATAMSVHNYYTCKNSIIQINNQAIRIKNRFFVQNNCKKSHYYIINVYFCSVQIKNPYS